MSSITETAKAFFAACEAGKGWDGCKSYCTPDATFSAQAEPLAHIKTLRDYTEWMTGLLATLTDGTYDLKVSGLYSPPTLSAADGRTSDLESKGWTHVGHRAFAQI